MKIFVVYSEMQNLFTPIKLCDVVCYAIMIHGFAKFGVERRIKKNYRQILMYLNVFTRQRHNFPCFLFFHPFYFLNNLKQIQICWLIILFFDCLNIHFVNMFPDSPPVFLLWVVYYKIRHKNVSDE